MKKLRLGMLGGGLGSMIGDIHRYAARLDNCYELVGGAFSTDYEKSLALGKELDLSPDRIYQNADELFAAELRLPSNERMQVISITTPNHLHYDMATKALKSGLHIILEKPITCTLQQAYDLQTLANTKQLNVCVMYTYTGYPMLKEAKQRIAQGEFGHIRKIFVDFTQGWLSSPIEEQSQKQAIWRTDPQQSGLSGTMADIGVHAFNLTEYLSQQHVTNIRGDIHSVVKDRLLDDDGAVFLQYDHGASGVLIASQVAAGEDANLKIRMYGEKGGIEWEHLHANRLKLKYADKPEQIIYAGRDNMLLSDHARKNCRTPKGHPDGYLEAFGNIYRNFAYHIHGGFDDNIYDYPKLEQGVRGMAFIEAIAASKNNTDQVIRLMNRDKERVGEQL